MTILIINTPAFILIISLILLVVGYITWKSLSKIHDEMEEDANDVVLEQVKDVKEEDDWTTAKAEIPLEDKHLPADFEEKQIIPTNIDSDELLPFKPISVVVRGIEFIIPYGYVETLMVEGKEKTLELLRRNNPDVTEKFALEIFKALNKELGLEWSIKEKQYIKK